MSLVNGAHVVIHSKDAEADRAFLRDVLGLRGVDAGDGWLIFALPPAEVAVHPAPRSGKHEFYFLCKDTDRFVAAMTKKGVRCEPVQDLRWGRLTRVKLPGGGSVGIYEPKHARPRATRRRS